MKHSLLFTLITVVLSAPAAGAQFQIDWYTIDSGSGVSTGGVFTVADTIGQPDVQAPPVMSGGSFELTGGFWAVTSSGCTCPGDINGDTLRNGRDIQQFVQCVIEGGACDCAEIDGVPGVNIDDVVGFVSSTLAGSSCP